MISVNGIQSRSDPADTATENDRRRAGRRSYQNPHLIELMRAKGDQPVLEDEEAFMETAAPVPIRPFLLLSAACLLFWGGVALLLTRL